ncbi:MAG: hypothetical protein JSV79_08390 [Armatimonadota bacterium]|nr:MAG: hypothetical protein JSV79_08390 [Armatimonadota bacterium]
MSRSAAAVLIAVGMVVGGLGWMFLPPDRGRFHYVVEIVDPRPWSESEMPEALREVRVTRLHGFLSRADAQVAAAAIIRLRGSDTDEGPAEIAMLQNMSHYITSADCQLGVVTEGGSAAAAGALSGIRRGTIKLGSGTIDVSALLGRLGPLFDKSLWIELSRPLMRELEEAGWQVQASFLLFPRTWREQQQVLAQLAAYPGSLPAPGSKILSPAEPPALSDPIRLALAAALVCAGLCVLVWQLRGTSREEVARRLGRK